MQAGNIENKASPNQSNMIKLFLPSTKKYTDKYDLGVVLYDFIKKKWPFSLLLSKSIVIPSPFYFIKLISRFYNFEVEYLLLFFILIILSKITSIFTSRKHKFQIKNRLIIKILYVGRKWTLQIIELPLLVFFLLNSRLSVYQEKSYNYF